MADFFTSDFHDEHPLVLTHRPFDTAAQMRNTLISNINAVCGPSDTLYMLGDWAMGMDKLRKVTEFRLRLRAGRVVWIRGNHDPSLEKMQTLVDRGIINQVAEMLTVKVAMPPITKMDGSLVPSKSKTIVLCHYPLEHFEFEEARTYHAHGHLHLPPERVKTPLRLRLDVGVDGHDFKPWSMEEIRVAMQGDWRPLSHHA